MHESFVIKDSDMKNKQVKGSPESIRKSVDRPHLEAGGSSNTLDKQVKSPHYKVPQYRSTGKERKIPVTRTNDFLW
jgi:hypothetical protein